MEAVTTVPCYHAASCPMLLWVLPRTLVNAISGEIKTVESISGRPGTSVDVFFNRGRAVPKGTQASASKEKRWQVVATAGAQMPRVRDHFADFLHSLAVIVFLLGI